MKKYMILVLMMFVLAGCNFALEKALDVRAKIKRNFINITLKVIDDKGNPIKDAEITVYFEDSYRRIANKAKSNKKGILKWSGRDFYGVNFVVEKTGFYVSGRNCEIPFKNNKRIYIYNFTDTIILYPIKNQVPLWYLKRSISAIWGENKPKMEFDLFKGDWLPPHGKGEVADFVTVGENHPRNTTVMFPNPGDGILRARKTSNPNEQVPPYDASDTGYISKATIDLINHDYYFRIRSKNGKGGFYGKIERKGSEITYFEYYINPKEGERNLEPDKQRTSTIGSPWIPYAQCAKSNLRIKVLGLNDRPLPNVSCKLSFLPGPDYPPQGEVNIKTQKDGITHPARAWVYDKVEVTIEAAGSNYRYDTTIHYPDTLRYDSNGHEVWKTWDDTIVFRPLPKIKPVTLKAFRKYDFLTIPPNMRLPYDLEMYEPTRPYGNGHHADCYLSLERKLASDTEYAYTFKMEFPEEGEGITPYPYPPLIFVNRKYDYLIYHKTDTSNPIQGSRDKFFGSYRTPDTKYQREIIVKNRLPRLHKGKSGVELYERFYIRFRTKKDKDGKVISRQYGIMKCFKVAFRPTRISLWYDIFLNPDGENNLEDKSIRQNPAYHYY